MNLSVGIAGLPNVGKSTLFNALLKKQQALAANYPFATIEPNIGIVAVPDKRLEVLARITAGVSTSDLDNPHPNLLPKGEGIRGTEKGSLVLPPIKPATVEFVDIAGLVKGASEGAGLGNKFLSHIREVQVIAHVVRAFTDPTAGSGQVPIIREGSVDPKTDYETIETELMLADLATLEKINFKKHESRIKNYEEVIDRLKRELNKGMPVRDIELSDEEKEATQDLFLLSAKPEIIVLNVSEEDYTEEKIPQVIERYVELLRHPGKPQRIQDLSGGDSGQARMTDSFVVISAQIESELAGLSEEEQKEYLNDLGLNSSGLERLIQKTYEKLGLVSFLTAGEKEVKAWTIRRGSTAVQASGEIHTDFMKKFIKAEVVSYEDFVSAGGWKKAREFGKARLEGKEYIVNDGDVIEFKIGS